MAKTHDLSRLLEALEEFESPVTVAARPLSRAFAGVYYTDRYPGFDLDDPDWPELRAQLTQVEALFAAVEANVPAD